MRNHSDKDVLGLVCFVDLLPVVKSVPGPWSASTSQADDSSSTALQQQYGSTSVPPYTFPENTESQVLHAGHAGSSQQTSYDHAGFAPRPPSIVYVSHASSPLSGTSVYVDQPRTDLIVGGKTVEPHVVDWMGERQIMFAFGVRFRPLHNFKFGALIVHICKDIAVKLEGTYLLHYRVVNLTDIAGVGYTNTIAECYGCPFEVYTTKDFPGLGPSTTLTNVSHSRDNGIRSEIIW
jgi:hypothetical protein